MYFRDIGPLAHDAEIDLLLQIETYFLTEVRKRFAQGMSLPTLLADMEANFPKLGFGILLRFGEPRAMRF